MKQTKKIAGFTATLALLGLSSLPASAGPVDLAFLGAGGVDDVFSCGSHCYQLDTTGVAIALTDSGQELSWGFAGALRFDSVSDTTGLGNWHFDDLTGGNNLWGTFSSAMLNGFQLSDWLNGAVGIGTLSYTVTGGTGLFDNATGLGQSLITYTIWAYGEAGWMHVETSSVPEPGTLALFGAALVGLAFATRRRRAVRS